MRFLPKAAAGAIAGAAAGLWLLFAAAGCGGGEPPPDFGNCPITYFDDGIPVPPVHLTTPFFFGFGAHVPRGDAGVAVDIEDGQGTVEIDGTGPMRAFVFNVSDWSDIDRTLYQGLAMKEGIWFPFWLYCADDGRLDRFWLERTDRPGWTAVIVDGVCTPTSTPSAGTLDLPGNTLRNVALTCGFSVTTTTSVNGQVDLGSSHPGLMTYPGHSAKIFVFNTYDCRTGCGSRNWFELHSIMWDADRNEVGFQIWYLDRSANGVFTDNTILLPGVASLNTPFPDATWELTVNN